MGSVIDTLYVDDESDLLIIGKKFLEFSGDIRVTTASGGNEALHLIGTHSFDVIISDYQMPGMDGISFLKHLKGQGDTTPFILFTGRGREEVVIEALNHGADFYLQKGGDPIAQFAELSSTIRQTVLRRHAERQLLESQKRLLDLIDFLPDATFAINTDGVVIFWNKAMEEMTGIAKEEMIGQGDHAYTIPFYGYRRHQLLDLLDMDDDEIAAKYQSLERRGSTLYAEFYSPTIYNGKGAYMWVTGAPLYDVHGNRIGAIESIRDITDRKQAEAKLQHNEEMYRLVLESTNDGFWEWDVASGTGFFSPRFYTMLGYEPGAFPPTFDAWRSLVHPQDQEQVRADLVRQLQEKRSHTRIEYRIKGKNGDWIWIYGRGKVVGTDEEGNVTRLIGTNTDITDRKMTEAHLHESNQKLRLLTGLTRHDIFNQLATVNLSLDLASDSDDRDEIHDGIRRAREAAERIGTIIGFTREYDGFGVETSGWQRITRIIADAFKEVSLDTVSADISVPDDLEVYADPIIRKVFASLIENALRHGGSITTIRFSCREECEGLVLACSDDGTGIGEDEKEKIFSHGYGNHTGIGLFIAREILSITGLSIRECGTCGEGARFEIFIPAGKFRFAGE